MSKHDNLADLRAELRDVIRRLRDLETANPLNHAAITGDGIRVLVPGGDGGAPVEEAKIGRADGKAGVLWKENGKWVSAREKVINLDGEIVSAKGRLDFTSNRLDDAEGRVGRLEPRMTETEIVAWAAKNATDDHEPRIQALKSGTDNMWNRLPVVESRSIENEKVAWAAKNAVDNHAPRIQSLEGSMAGKAAKSVLDAAIDRINELDAQMKQYHPEKIIKPPLVKG